MKEWFRYEFGYVNIDDDCIYLTASGNWIETKTLFEKTAIVTQKNDLIQNFEWDLSFTQYSASMR